MIEFLRANAPALVIGLYLLGGAGGLAVIMSFAFLVEPPLKTIEQYNRSRRVANIGITVMAVIVPALVGALCYIAR